MSARTKQIEAIFHAASELSTAEERESYLNQACLGDDGLRKEVDALLKAALASKELFRDCEEERSGGTPVAPLAEQPGTMIGRYKLLEKIGEGGMGVVYMAEQEQPVRRKVALKIIKLGMDTRQVVARFEAERQALAMMDHPHIARVLDGGATETGRPYFVMELVQGVPITQFCEANQLSVKERLNLFIPVCEAIQSAHQKGIIHRDIKPSNVLVTTHNGAPHPMVIDFGVAKAIDQKLTEKTLFTNFATMIGTPAYMSPEQAEMSKLDVDTRSDIYSLGVLLYELLTGTTPFSEERLRSVAYAEMQRIITEEEPERPSTRLRKKAATGSQTPLVTRHSSLATDLDWIVMKCLEKDRNRRYETANGVAADIHRHLANEPVVARPPSRLYELQKTVRRHKLGFAAGSAVGLALVIGLGISTVLLIKERQARERAVAAERVAETSRANESTQRQQAQEERARAEIAERKAQAEATRSAQEAQFMKDMLKGVGPAVALGRDTKLLREILDQTALRLKTDLAGHPEVEADLRETLGVVYRDLGEFTNAVAMLQESLVLRSNLYGRPNAAVASSLHNLAEALRLQWNNREAAAMFREALAIRTNLNEPVDVAASMFGLAETLRRESSWRTEAEQLHSEALALRRKWLGKHADTAMSLVGLGITLRDLFSKLKEAESNQTEAVVMLRELYGDVHPTLSQALFNLGGTLVRMPERLADAETNLLQALAIQQKLFGDPSDTRHNHTSQALGFLGDVYLEQGRLAEAESMYSQRLQIVRRRSDRKGPPAPEIALAGVLRLQRKPEAEALQREALENLKAYYRAELAPGNYNYWLFQLAKALHHQGKPAEVEALLAETREIREKLFSNELSGLPESETNFIQSVTRPGKFLRQSRGIVSSLQNLGHTFAELDAPAEAEAMYREAIRVDQPATFVLPRLKLVTLLLHEGKRSEAETLVREVGDTDSPDAQNELAWFLATWADPQQRDGRRAVNHAEKAVTATNRKNVSYLDTLAAAYARAGDFTSAVEVQREAKALIQNPALKKDFEFRFRLYQSNEPYVDHANLAETVSSLLAAGRYAVAEPLARDCVKILEKEQPDGRRLFLARSLLGRALLGQGNYSEAEPIMLACYEGLKQQTNSFPEIHLVLQSMVQLYEATGQSRELAQWKEKLAELDAGRRAGDP